METKLLEIVLKNKFIPAILDAAEKAGLPDWYLAAGCVTETVWNSLHGFPLEFGIKDYDIVYFDPTKKDDPEKVDLITKANPGVEIEVVNQAFVHTWFKEDFGYEIPSFTSTEHSMSTWGSPISAVGIRKVNGTYKVYAPFGVGDIFDMVVRPNESSFYISGLFIKKAHAWKEKWPKLTVIMPKEESKISKYNTEWFKKRASESIRQMSPHVWDYSDSLLLYISSGVEKYESLQETDTPYFNLVTKPEREYLQSIAKDVVDLLPSNFEYIDLGPGTEHKEQFFFDELKKQGKQFTYIPVDISEHYLNLAEKHAVDQDIPVRPVQASFEEVAEILGSPTVPRFVNIGLTFSNYEPQIILDLLKGIAREGGYAFINSQMKDRVDMAALQKVYAEDALTLADDKLKLVGLNPDTDITPREANFDIRVWCSVINTSKELEQRGIINGDKLLVFQSLRYTPEQLENELKKSTKSYHLFDTGASFVAALVT